MNMAKNAQAQIINEYELITRQFYNEYTPKFYNRMYGLDYSYKPYYNNSWNKYFEGGIHLSENGIDIDYEYGANRIEAFDSFLNGYHGCSSLGIYSFVQPYKHMINFRDYLISNWNTIFLPDAVKKARQRPYSVIMFK